MRRADLALVAALALGGCATAPRLSLPAVPVADEFKHGAAWRAAQPGDHLPRGEWWRDFGDPLLDELIVRADADAPTLAGAVARIDRATANARIARAGQYPSLDAWASASREDDPVSGSIGRNVAGGALSYEIDLWGRARSEASAGEAEAAAAAADMQSVRLSLHAAIAESYIVLRALDAEQALLDRTAAAYVRADQLIRTRYEGGIASGVDVSRSAAQLASVRARREILAGERASIENAIAVLVGSAPSAFTIPQGTELPRLPAITPGFPSLLLERRDDVARAERRLAAANARIGAARAALFPTLSLGLGGGLQANGAPLLGAPVVFWALGPLAAALNLFDGGRRRAQVDVREAEYRELAASYRETVLNAFREVEDALARASALARQEQALAVAAQASARSEELAFDRYRDGAADYLEVLTAQAAALDSEQAYLEVQSRRRREAVTLVRALGGGWQASVRADLASTSGVLQRTGSTPELR